MELMGKVMAKWWHRRWRLVLVAFLLPILLVPLISIFLFPETPLTKSLLYGLVFSFFVLWAFLNLGLIEFWGLRFVILVMGGTALLSLLLISMFRIRDSRIGFLVIMGWVLLVLLVKSVFKIWKY